MRVFICIEALTVIWYSCLGDIFMEKVKSYWEKNINAESINMTRIYLDNCCFNRPYDNQLHLKIELETKAKLKIQEMIVDGDLELVISYILEHENDENACLERKFAIADFFKYAILDVEASEEVIKIANGAKKTGLKTKDALHVACAIVSGCDYLITTDKRFLNYNDDRIHVLNPMQFLLEMEE